MTPANPMRGEVIAKASGRDVRLCVTLRSLAQMERHFAVSSLEDLGARLRTLSASDLMAIYEMLVMDDDPARLEIDLVEATRAVTAAFAAMNPDDGDV